MLSSLFCKWNELDHNRPIKYYCLHFANKEISLSKLQTVCPRSESSRQSAPNTDRLRMERLQGGTSPLPACGRSYGDPVLWSDGFTLLPRWVFLSGWFTEAETRKCSATDFRGRTYRVLPAIPVINWWCWRLWHLFHFGCCSSRSSPFCHCQRGDLPSGKGRRQRGTYRSQKLSWLERVCLRPTESIRETGKEACMSCVSATCRVELPLWIQGVVVLTPATYMA